MHYFVFQIVHYKPLIWWSTVYQIFLLKNGKYSATQTDSFYKSHESISWGIEIDTPLGGREGRKAPKERERTEMGKWQGEVNLEKARRSRRSKVVCHLPRMTRIKCRVRWLSNVFITFRSNCFTFATLIPVVFVLSKGCVKLTWFPRITWPFDGLIESIETHVIITVHKQSIKWHAARLNATACCTWMAISNYSI